VLWEHASVASVLWECVVVTTALWEGASDCLIFGGSTMFMRNDESIFGQEVRWALIY